MRAFCRLDDVSSFFFFFHPHIPFLEAVLQGGVSFPSPHGSGVRALAARCSWSVPSSPRDPQSSGIAPCSFFHEKRNAFLRVRAALRPSAAQCFLSSAKGEVFFRARDGSISFPFFVLFSLSPGPGRAEKQTTLAALVLSPFFSLGPSGGFERKEHSVSRLLIFSFSKDPFFFSL